MNFINLVFSSPKLQEELTYKANPNFVRSPLFVKLTNNEIEEANEYIKSIRTSYGCSLFENALLVPKQDCQGVDPTQVFDNESLVKNTRTRRRRRSQKPSKDRRRKPKEMVTKLSYADAAKKSFN